jgi:FlaA1/EpsC-like NDP-sugar epimerase
MNNIILVGAGGHCKSCIDVIEKEKKYKIIGLVDNKKKGVILNYKILLIQILIFTLFKFF